VGVNRTWLIERYRFSEDAINNAAADQYKNDRAGFEKEAREWTAKHASK